MNTTPMSRLLTSAIAAFGVLMGTTYAGGIPGGSRTSTPHRASFQLPRSHTHHHRTPTLPSPLRIPQTIPHSHMPAPIRNAGIRPAVAPQLTHSSASTAVQVHRNPLPTTNSSASRTQTQVTSNGPTTVSNAANLDRLRTRVQSNPANVLPPGLANFTPSTFGAPPVAPSLPEERSIPHRGHTQLAQAPAPSPPPSPMSDASPGRGPSHRPTLDELSVHLSDEEMAVVLAVLLRAQQLRERRPSQPASTPAVTPTTASPSTGRLAVYDTPQEALEAAGRFGSGARVQAHDTGLTRDGRPIVQYDVVR